MYISDKFKANVLTTFTLFNRFDQNFINTAASWTNTNYGGMNINVNRVVFVHGSVDPWHVLGITQTQDNDAPAIYIPGKYCIFMYFFVQSF